MTQIPGLGGRMREAPRTRSYNHNFHCHCMSATARQTTQPLKRSVTFTSAKTLCSSYSALYRDAGDAFGRLCEWSGKGYAAIFCQARLHIPSPPACSSTSKRGVHGTLLLAGYRAWGEGSIPSFALPSEHGKKALWIPGSGGSGTVLPGKR